MDVASATRTVEKNNRNQLYTTVSTLPITLTRSNNGDKYKCTVSGKALQTPITKELTVTVECEFYLLFNSRI